MRPSLPTVRLRAPGPAERALALDLIMAFHAEEADPLSAETAGRALDLILAGDPLVRLWLVEAGGEVVGYVCLGLGFSIEIGGRDFWIDDLYVRPDRRGRGVGTAALARVEAASRVLGARRLCLEVRHGNEAAGRLYERSGYVAHARSLMSKPLEAGPAPPDGASVDVDQ
jgi:GNAT superfamily N-acetyltransferase